MNHRERIERIFKECEPGAWGVSGVTSWEKDRMFEWREFLKQNPHRELSPRQERILADIEHKVFGEGETA